MKICKASTLIISLSLSSFGAFAAQDNQFQHEASIGYATNTDNMNKGHLGVDYRYYLTPIDQNTSPYALNGFLAQTSNFGVNYYYDRKNDSTNSVGIDGTYVFNNNLFVGLSFQANNQSSRNSNDYGIELGYYFSPVGSVSAFFNEDDHSGSERYGLDARYYLELASTAGIDLSAGWQHEGSSNLYHAAADWYLSNSWSVGSSYVRTAEDNSGKFDVSTAYWLRITDSISTNVEASKVIDSDYDGLNLNISLIGRF